MPVPTLQVATLEYLLVGAVCSESCMHGARARAVANPGTDRSNPLLSAHGAPVFRHVRTETEDVGVRAGHGCLAQMPERPATSESRCKPDPWDEWKPRNACDLGWQSMRGNTTCRDYGSSDTEFSGKREMMGVTPRSPPAAADSLTPHCT